MIDDSEIDIEVSDIIIETYPHFKFYTKNRLAKHKLDRDSAKISSDQNIPQEIMEAIARKVAHHESL